MMKRNDAIKYLLREGNLNVPGGRYGDDTLSCAKVAWRVCKNIAWHDAVQKWHGLELITHDNLDQVMGMVVNSSDEVAYILKEYRIPRSCDKSKKTI